MVLFGEGWCDMRHIYKFFIRPLSNTKGVLHLSIIEQNIHVFLWKWDVASESMYKLLLPRSFKDKELNIYGRFVAWSLGDCV